MSNGINQQFGFSAMPRVVLLTVLGYEGLGALLGGALLIAGPDGRYMEMPVKIMHGAFPDFFIPGMLLLGLGILNSVSFITVLRRAAWDWILACLALGGLVIWFIVEMIILRELHWLHLMWGLPVLLGSIAAIPLVASSNNTAAMQKALLSCGVISSLWYIAINFYVPEQYTGYSTTSFTVSELSAIGAPTRILWTLLVLPYPVLFSAFGWGVLQTSGAKHF